MWPVITHDNTEYRFLLPTAYRRLVHDTAHDLAIDNDQPAIVGREIWYWVHVWRVVTSIGLLLLVTLRLDVHEHLRLFVWADEDVEYLLPGP